MTALDCINIAKAPEIASVAEFYAYLVQSNAKVFVLAMAGDTHESKHAIAEFGAICKRAVVDLKFYLTKPVDDLIKAAIVDQKNARNTRCASLVDAAGRIEIETREFGNLISAKGRLGLADNLIASVAGICLIMEDLDLPNLKKKS